MKQSYLLKLLRINKLVLIIIFLLFSTQNISNADENNSNINIHGYLQLETSTGAREGSFVLDAHRSELGFSYKPFSNVKCFISIGKDELNRDGNYILLKDLRVDMEFSPLFILSLGQYKSPFSYELLKSEEELDFINRSEATEILGPQRMLGIQITGKTGFLVYALKISDSLYQGDGKYINGRIILSITDWLHFAISEYYDFSWSIRRMRMVTSAGEIILDFSPVVFNGEYLHGYPHRNDYMISYMVTQSYSEGWYAKLGYRILDDMEVVIKWDHSWIRNYYKDSYTKNKYIAGINYYFTKNLKFQFNWEHVPFSYTNENKFLFQLQTSFDLNKFLSK